MIVKLYTETLEEQPVWIDFDVDQHSINGYWNVPAHVDPEGVVYQSDEWNVMIHGTVVTIRDCETLLTFLKHKFER